MVSLALAPANARFIATRRVVFGIVLASFVLSFFHRTAPAAIAGELTRAFSINAAALGTLAATYFYVYTLLQITSGRTRQIPGLLWVVSAAFVVFFAIDPVTNLLDSITG